MTEARNVDLLSSLVWNVILKKDIKSRVKAGIKLLDFILNEKQQNAKVTEDMIDKLVKAGQTIRDQNELLECCYSILGDKAGYIVNTWETLKSIKERERDKNGLRK